MGQHIYQFLLFSPPKNNDHSKINYFYLIFADINMRSVKSRNWSNQQDKDLASVMEDLQQNQKKLTWNQIAGLIQAKNPECTKTGKQCRQRWTNQLSPNIKRFQEWSKQQNEKMFGLHQKLGNKWSEISNQLPGRTDNCIKNHFYSVMRKGFRIINSYIENVRRKQSLVKTFKNQILNKILTICEGKNNDKFRLSSEAQQLALAVKSKLVLVSLGQQQSANENLYLKEQIYLSICEFARNCRRKKIKKNSQSQQLSLSQQSVNYKHYKNKQLIKQKKKNQMDQTFQNQVSSIKKQAIQLVPTKNQINSQSTIPKTGKIKLQVVNQYNQGKVQNKQEQKNVTKQQKVELLGSSLSNNRLISSFSYNFPVKNSSSFFSFGAPIEIAQEWGKNSGFQQTKKTGFISTVPDVTNKKASNQIQLNRGQMDFTNFGDKGIASELQKIFQKPISVNQTVVMSDLAKSNDLQKSFNFSSAIKESPMFFQINPQIYNIPNPFSNSPFPGMSSSSGFGLYNSSNWFGKQSQQLKFRSTKYQQSQKSLDQKSLKNQ